MFCLGRPKPDPSVNVTNTSSPRLGQSASFQLKTIGNPVPTYAWWFNTTSLKHVDTDFTTSIEITNVKVESYGEYKLLMSNKFGNNTVWFQLKPMGK